jgi:hypothetical protein
MEKRKERQRGRIPLSGYLGCLIVVSAVSLLAGLVYARYTSGAGSQSGVTVAAWAVDATPVTDGEEIVVVSGKEGATATGNYDFYVTNGKGGSVCAVAFSYDLEVTLPDALSGAAISLNLGDNVPITGTPDEKDPCKWTFKNANMRFGAPDPNDSEPVKYHHFTLTFDKKDINTISYGNTMTIRVLAHQIAENEEVGTDAESTTE